MKKRKRKKQRIKKSSGISNLINIVYGLIIFYLVISIGQIVSRSNRFIKNSPNEVINYTLADSFIYFGEENSFDTAIDYIVYMSSNIKFLEPITIFKETLPTYLEYSSNILNISNDDDYSDLENLMEVSNYVSIDTNDIVEDPVVYIYNTHQLENYRADQNQAYNIVPTVMMASYILKTELDEFGIQSVIEDANFTEFLNNKGWKYWQSYKVSRYYVNQANDEYGEFDLYVDLHRDSLNYDKTIHTYEGNNYAKILFVVGLENPNYEYNLDLANKMHDYINETVPGLSKGIITKSGKGVDGVYNQDVSPNAMLIELGGVDNTIDEVNNSVKVVASVLKRCLDER